MTFSQNNDLIFICYAEEDWQFAKNLYLELKVAGLRPWLNTEDLLAGSNWKQVISNTIKESTYFLALLSKNSVDKRGYVQKEIREGLEILDMVPDSEIYLIPIRLDDCEPSHPKITNLHWIDIFKNYQRGLKELVKVIGSEVIDLAHLDSLFINFSATSPPTVTLSCGSIRRPDSNPVEFSAIVDIGASITLIPEHVLEQLSHPSTPIEEGPAIKVAGVFSGSGSIRKTYFVDLIFAGKTFKQIRVLTVSRDTGIIGLDVLQFLVFVFDGPENSIRIWN